MLKAADTILSEISLCFTLGCGGPADPLQWSADPESEPLPGEIVGLASATVPPSNKQQRLAPEQECLLGDWLPSHRQCASERLCQNLSEYSVFSWMRQP